MDGKKTTYAPAEVALLVGQVEAETKQLDNALAELETREWKKSELDRLRQHFRDSPAYGADAFLAFESMARQATVEGRVRDDTSPTLENLAAHFGKEAWLMVRGEIAFASDFASWLERNPVPGSAWELQSKYQGLQLPGGTWTYPATALRDWRDTMARQGRVALVGNVLPGLLWQRALPWSQRTGSAIPQWEEQPGDGDLVEAQAVRLEVLGMVYRYAAERFRTTPSPTTRNLDEVLAHPHGPGLRWEGFQTREAFRQNLARFQADTNRGRRSIEGALRELERTNRATVETAIRAGIEAGTAVAMAGGR